MEARRARQVEDMLVGEGRAGSKVKGGGSEEGRGR